MTERVQGNGWRRFVAVVRGVAFAAAAAVVAGLVALLPSGAWELANTILFIAGLGGGQAARSWREVLAITGGGMAGALGVGLATFGTDVGPHSPWSVVFGVVVVGVVLLVSGGAYYWIRLPDDPR